MGFFSSGAAIMPLALCLVLRGQPAGAKTKYG
eukprot:COSAG04_NODE_5768_length_1498_cov_1.023588_1_plen_31_part_10